jgi:hypothetical protein
MPLYRDVDMPNGNHWGLHIYEIIIPEGQVRDMTAQEIGEQVLRLTPAPAPSRRRGAGVAEMPAARDAYWLEMYLEEHR